MAKGNKLFRRQQSTINELDRALRADLGADMSFSQNQLGAIFGNLAASGRGAKRKLTQAQTRELEAIGRLARSGARANNQAISGVQRNLGNSFGGEFGAAIQQALGPMQAARTANKTVTRAIGASGVLLAAGGQGAVAVQREAANEARAGADYQLASAYAERSKADATEVARAQLALDQMKLQAQLDWENRRKEMLLVKRLEEEDTKTGSRQQLAGMTSVAETMSMASPKLRSLAETGDYDSKQQLYAAYVEKYGAPQDQAEQLILQNLAGALLSRGIYGSNGPGRDAEIDAIMDSMLTLYPNFAGGRKQIQSAIDAALKAQYNQGAVNSVEESLQNGTPIQYPPGLSGAEKRIWALQHGFTPVPSQPYSG